MEEKKKSLRPIYKKSFCIEEEFYASPEEKEPCFAHRVAGHFSVDLVRAAAVTATALLVSAALARIITREKNV